MERAIKDLNLLSQFCTDFCKVIEKHCKYIIVSGFVAIASGRTRGTEDIDMIIERINIGQFKIIFDDLLHHGFVCMQTSHVEEAFSYLADNLSLRFTRKDKFLPEMEVKFVKDDIDTMQIRNRVKLPLTGLDVWFSDINTNIAFKEEWLKSPKDMEDARHLRIVYREMIDEDNIKMIKQLIQAKR